MENSHSYFKNKDCKYYPCHNIEEGELNCLFCYCPLYALGEECGGSFSYTKEGVKDCSNCVLPHSKDGYNHIMSKCPSIIEMLKEKNREN